MLTLEGIIAQGEVPGQQDVSWVFGFIGFVELVELIGLRAK